MRSGRLHGAAAAALALLCLAGPAYAPAQTPTRLIVTTPPGGGLDSLGRALAAGISRQGGDVLIVENRPGAGGIIGADHVAKATPDGRTVLLATGFVALTMVLNRAPYDALRDFAPVVELPIPHQILIARPGLGIQNPADLAPVAAATRGGLNCAGFVGEPHLACELLRHQLGGASVTVPYNGAPQAAQALAAGQVDLMVASYEVAVSLQAAGRAVPIASSGSRPAAPPFDKLPLMKDLWPTFVFDGVLGILAPAGTPQPVVRQIEQQFRQVLRDPSMRDALAQRGLVSDQAGSPEQLAQRLREKLVFYRRLAEQLGLKPE